MLYPYTKMMKSSLDRANITPENIDELLGLFQGVFGMEWLEQLETDRKLMPLIGQHPIINGCASGSFSELISVMELGVCLVSFKDDPELIKMVPAMKSVASYRDCYLQLAMAYRFKMLGYKVSLEPSIGGGLLADFQAIKSQRSLVVECTVLHRWITIDEEIKAFQDLVSLIRKFYKKGSNEIVVSLSCSSPFNMQTLPAIRSDIAVALTKFSKSSKLETVSTPEHTVVISPMDALTKNALNGDGRADLKSLDADKILSFKMVPIPSNGDIVSTINQSVSTSLLKYKNANPIKDPLEDRIDRKANEKIRQIKQHPANSVPVLIIEVEDRLEDINITRVGNRFENNIFKKVPNLQAVFLTKRVWTTKERFQYQGHLFSNPHNPLDDSIFNEINVLEGGIDFVQEWKSR